MSLHFVLLYSNIDISGLLFTCRFFILILYQSSIFLKIPKKWKHDDNKKFPEALKYNSQE